jgi:alpha-glucosidase
VTSSNPHVATADTSCDADWWRTAVTYQIYIRSFADADGDGLGDVEGMRSRLAYLAALGVDAVWINPWYPSPQVDHGYDVADYRDIEPAFGTLDEAQRFIDDAHDHGIRVILDIVPNHTSDAHAWFVAALASPPGSPERARYIFRPGKGAEGALPPNDWEATFGGSAWTQVTEPDGRPGEWYLHLFAVEQPDLNWDNREVRDEFLDVLRFWFERGVDGFRIDVAHGLVKDPALPDLDVSDLAGPVDHTPVVADRLDHPFWDRPGVHDVYREWREVADSFDPPRTFVAEAWVATAERLAAYLRADELHTAFDFDMVRAPWRADALVETAKSSLASHAMVGAPVTWVLSNHDILRHLSRYGRPQPRRGEPVADVFADPVATPDVPLGRRRARAAILFELALPGAVYLYQGEELGLEEVEDLPEDVLADPIWEMSGHKRRGRDGCRVPIPWTTSGPSLGFGTAAPWLPQPAAWAELSVQAQEADPGSMLSLYRDALRIRRIHPVLGSTASELEWLDLGDDVIAIRRQAGFTCIVNLGATEIELPPGEVVLSSVAVTETIPGTIPSDTTVWLDTAPT